MPGNGLTRIQIAMIVLASASPRRQELLHNAGIPFTVQAANINERPLAGESARDCAERLAREKAMAVFQSRPQQCVLGADTIVVVADTILGKPGDAEDAARMLRLLAGRTHAVITGVCLVGPVAGGQWSEASKSKIARVAGRIDRKPTTGHPPLATALERTASESTLVTFCELSDDEIRDYIATGEPMDKAGAYAIQGVASRWIPRIDGSYSNVVGLPVALVYAMLREREML
jgi:septum formation protein